LRSDGNALILLKGGIGVTDAIAYRDAVYRGVVLYQESRCRELNWFGDRVAFVCRC
jgi:hypothetical protein